VIAIWNELIALDLAKTLTNHYSASVRRTHIKPKHHVQEDGPERNSLHGKHLRYRSH
jgi:hypothetical protein